MIYFVIWGDYDGPRVEKYSAERDMLERVAVLHRDHPGDERGFQILVVHGRELDLEPVQTVTLFRVKR